MSGTPGVPGALGIALEAGGIGVLTTTAAASNLIWGTEARANMRLPGVRCPALRVSSSRILDEADLVLYSSDGRTPMLLALGESSVFASKRSAYERVWEGSITGRLAIATPYDLAVLILRYFRIPKPGSFIGGALEPCVPCGGEFVGMFPGPSPSDGVLAIAARLRRDAGYQQSLTAWTVIIGLGFGVLGAFGLAALGFRNAARRVTTGAGFATAGYLIGLFIPHARGDVRALGVFGLFLLGALAVPDNVDRIRLAAQGFGVVAIGTYFLASEAAGNPNGRIANAFWANPLESFRFFGFLNYQAALMAGGIVGLIALGPSRKPNPRRRGPQWPIVAYLLVVGLGIVGAPGLGANFVGVLTMAFGGAIGVLALKTKRFARTHVAYAAAFAILAFGIALAADRAFGNSHGARAAEAITSGGLSTVFDLIKDRLRLNVDAIRAFPGGVLIAPVFVLIYANMIRWGIRDEFAAFHLRVAIVAGSAAGLAALVLEDSGLKTTAVLGFPALILWTLAQLRDHSDPKATSGRQLPS